MITTRTKSILTTFVLAVIGASTAQAGIILGLLNNPATTAGVATSTRSGANTWQLYAIETANSSDLGIASYSISIPGATAINHRSPNGTAMDVNGDVQNWGYTLLRSGTNVNPIVASEPLTGTTPFVITGLGISAGNASSQILSADPGATGITALSGASWGNYATAATSRIPLYEGQTGHKWVFLAEGLGSPFFSGITGQFTVLSNAQGAQVAGTFTGVVDLFNFPEPATWLLAGFGSLGPCSFIRRRSARGSA